MLYECHRFESRDLDTGSAAGQIAKLLGCRVVGITGGPEKVEYITKELGFDVGIDYHKHNTYESMHAALAAVSQTECPAGYAP